MSCGVQVAMPHSATFGGVLTPKKHAAVVTLQVKYNRDLCKVILGIWSWSVLQFTMVFTATKAPRREVVSAAAAPQAAPGDSCCTPDVVGIIMSIFMQDGPFLVLRMLLIFKYSVFSYTNMFFTCKNTLVCMLLMYRLIVIQVRRTF